MKTKRANSRGWSDDPSPYTGSIERADGVRPYNMFLWPTESWWVGHQPQFRNVVSGMYHFEYIALKDGRFSTEGAVYHIEENRDSSGLPCVFNTKIEAIRTSAARLISQMRYSSRSTSYCVSFDRLDRETLQAAINWIRKTVAEACAAAAPREITLPIPPPPPKSRDTQGLELFDLAAAKGSAS